ncbi:hypothetical protein 15570_00010 [Lokiarchaeota virus WyrdV1]|nr:hypothetical protein 15570_00010 [Lokiarchaeota virus WyrdV1]
MGFVERMKENHDFITECNDLAFILDIDIKELDKWFNKSENKELIKLLALIK